MDSSTPTTTAPTGKNYKWVLLALLWMAYFLLQGTRQIYGSVLPQIKSDFSHMGVTDAQMGMVGTIFTLVYGLAVPVAGLCADLFKRKWMIVGGVAVFSLGIFGSGFANSLAMLVLFYGILNAVGQCMVPSSCTSLITQYHNEARTTALSLYQTALYVGVIMCSFISGWLGGMGAGTWKWAFLIFGGIGLVWAVILAFTIKDTVQPGEDKKGAPKATIKDALASLLSKPSALLLTVAFGTMVWTTQGYATWTRKFMTDQFSLSSSAASFHNVFWHFVGALLGILLASAFTDRLARVRKGVRMEIAAIGLIIGAPFLFLAAYAQSLTMCCLFLFLFGVGHGIFDSNLFAALYDVVVPRYRAAATGLYCCGAFVLGCPSPTVTGWLIEHHSLSVGFATLAASYLIGAVVIFTARVFFLKRDWEG